MTNDFCKQNRKGIEYVLLAGIACFGMMISIAILKITFQMGLIGSKDSRLLVCIF
jgi:hypothetical protein